MRIRCLLLSCFPLICSAQSVAFTPVNIPEAQLEAAHQANPDNLDISWRLLRYYSLDARDTGWSSRFAIISYNIQHNPEAPFFGSQETYRDIPDALRSQAKQMWIAQVQQHPDNPGVLRNAALVMEKVPQSIRVGMHVAEANLVQSVQPVYPPEARQAGVQGPVRLSARIDVEGNITNVTLLSGHPLLVQPALSAVVQWKYRPTLLNGIPVAVATEIEVPFVLDGPAPPVEQLNVHQRVSPK